MMHDMPNEIQRDMRRRILLLDGAAGTYFQALAHDDKAFIPEPNAIKAMLDSACEVYGEDIASRIPLRVFDTIPKSHFEKDGISLAEIEAVMKNLGDTKGNYDLLNITEPEVVQAMHKQYLEAGADIVETNTFNSNRISQGDYGLECLSQALNFAAGKLALSAANGASRECDAGSNKHRRRYVVGSMGPTPRTASVSSDVQDPAARKTDFDILHAIYFEAALALLASGVRILLVETAFDTLNAKAAAIAADDAGKALGIGVPGDGVSLILSVTLTDLAGRNLSGQTVEAFLISMAHFKPLALGINCSLGPKEMSGFIADLARISPFPIIAYPNAGMPNELAEYDEDPISFSKTAGAWARDGLVNIIGGCCGTTSQHIAALKGEIEGAQPRAIKDKGSIDAKGLYLAGIDPLLIPDPAFGQSAE